MRWIYVTMDYATFALGVRDGVVQAGPPIANWAMGKSESQVASYYKSRGAKFSDLWFESA